jgi:hypothetical protein
MKTMAVIDPARLQLLGHFDHLFLQVKRERQLVQFAKSSAPRIGFRSRSPLYTVKGDREATLVPPAIPPPSSFSSALGPSEGGGGLNRRADLCARSLGQAR